MKPIVILSRKEAMEWTFDYPYAHISIRAFSADGGYDREYKLSRDDNRKALLRLYFDDTTPEDEGDYRLMSPSDAAGIVEFVRCFKDKVDGFVVNCDAGLSRSAGVGAALCAILEINDDPCYVGKHPNVFCKKLVLEAAG